MLGQRLGDTGVYCTVAERGRGTWRSRAIVADSACLISCHRPLHAGVTEVMTERATGLSLDYPASEDRVHQSAVPGRHEPPPIF